MSIVLTVASGDVAADLAGLADTLSADDELRGLVRPVRGAPRAGEMGTAVEALAIALGPGGAATALAAGIALWLRRRRSGKPGSVELKIEFPDGSRLLLDADGVEDVRAVVAEAVKPWTVRQ